MAQADWAELFRPPPPRPARAMGSAWRLPRWFWERLTGWEDWLTFLIAYLAFLGVALSIQGAEWVEGMPNLALMGFLGLLCALLLARSAIPAILSHLLSIVFGGLAILWQVLSTVPGDDWFARWDAFYARMDHWFDVAARGGISNDTLPFVVLVVGLAWLCAYAFGWSVFRWQNPWLGLLPGGAALFANFTFSDQLGILAVLYLGGALLLVMRVSLARNLRDWRREGTPYPSFLSLSSVHLTGWAVGLLLLVAWLAPVATEAQPLSSVWDDLARPFLSLSDDTVRLIGPVKTTKVLPIHAFKSVLPFQGSIRLRERNVLSLTLDKAEGLANYPFLRGAVYDEYTAGGWLAGERHETDLPPTDLSPDGNQQLLTALGNQRLIIAHIQVADSRVARSVLFTIGEPLAADMPTKAEATEDWNDGQGTPPRPSFSITLLRPLDMLAPGATYSTAGLVTDATADDLRTDAGTPDVTITRRYTQLPDDLPRRVRDLAHELTAGQPTTYDKVKAVEEYLRQLPIAYRLLDVPPGEDAVDYFLFEAKEGFFDYHASAMVVLLRAVGIPARLAVGYALDPRAFDADNRRYNIREEHAYAWAEVYFEGFGWLAFNPSPERPAVLRQGDITGGGATWFGNIDPSILGSLGIGLQPQQNPSKPPEASPAQAAAGGKGGIPLAVWLALGLAAVAVVLVGASGRLAWERALAGLPYPQRIWEQTVRLAGWARLGPRPEQTPAEYARDLQTRLPDVAGLEQLAVAYGRSRFGRKLADAEENECLRAVWRRLRTKLLLRILFWR